MLQVWRIHLQRRLAPVYAISGFAASKSDEDAALAPSAPAEQGRSGASKPSSEAMEERLQRLHSALKHA